jgi:putative spermidine/putrescine transport system substrate-binding protein
MLSLVGAQEESGNVEWDVTQLSSYGNGLLAEQAGYLEKLDTSLFPVEFYPPTTLSSDYWQSLEDTALILVYNTDVFSDPAKAPKSVLDIFNTTDFPGKRCIFDGTQLGWNLELALLADGVPFSQVYDLLATPEGRKRAFDKLDTIKDDIVFWGSGAESVQFVLDGQCDLSTSWNGRPALRLRDEPTLPLAAVWKDFIVFGDAWTVLKGAPHFKAAESALAYALVPANTCKLLGILGYGQVLSTPPFPDCLSDFAKEWAPDPSKGVAGAENPGFYLDNLKTLSDEWNAWKVGVQ